MRVWVCVKRIQRSVFQSDSPLDALFFTPCHYTFFINNPAGVRARCPLTSHYVGPHRRGQLCTIKPHYVAWNQISFCSLAEENGFKRVPLLSCLGILVTRIVSGWFLLWWCELRLIEAVRFEAAPRRSSVRGQTIGSMIRASGMSRSNVGSDLKGKESGRRYLGVLHHNVRLWARASPRSAALFKEHAAWTEEGCTSIASAPLSSAH